MKNVLTIDMAAKLYEGTALTKTAIRNLVVSGKIPSQRVGTKGTKYVILEDDIEAWLKGKIRKQATSPPQQSGKIRRIEARA